MRPKCVMRQSWPSRWPFLPRQMAQQLRRGEARRHAGGVARSALIWPAPDASRLHSPARRLPERGHALAREAPRYAAVRTRLRWLTPAAVMCPRRRRPSSRRVRAPVRELLYGPGYEDGATSLPFPRVGPWPLVGRERSCALLVTLSPPACRHAYISWIARRKSCSI